MTDRHDAADFHVIFAPRRPDKHKLTKTAPFQDLAHIA